MATIATRRARTIAESFDPRANSLNALRLVFALFVLFSHAISVGGYGSENIIGSATLGDIGVDGFFGLSGFLITRSAMNSPTVRRFFWHRFLRIYPGLWLCLIVVAFVIAPIAWKHEYPSAPFGEFFSNTLGPFHYVTGNLLATTVEGTHPGILATMPTTVAGTPINVPTPYDWSGQLWTIEFEVLCYLLVAFFSFTGILRKRWPIVLFMASLWTFSCINDLLPNIWHGDLWYWGQNFRLGAVFFLGSCLYLFAKNIPDSPYLAFVMAGLFAFGLTMNNSRNLDVLCGPAMVYLTMWLGIHLPLRRVGRRNDLSYGFYIYAFPMLQIYATFGLNSWGYLPYSLLSMVSTFGAALISWKLVEQRAMRAKGWRLKIVKDAIPIGLEST